MEPVPTNRDESCASRPQIVSREEWQRARDQLLVKEKAATRARDALAAERRRLPMVRIEKDYVFDGPGGKVGLLDLFEGRRQLIIYHFMFAPGVEGWPLGRLLRLLYGCRLPGPPPAPACPRHFPRPGLACATDKTRILQAANGLESALVFLRRHRLQRRLWREHR